MIDILKLKNMKLEEATNGEFSVLSYTDSSSPTTIRHNTCGYVFNRNQLRISEFNKNSGCKLCREKAHYKEKETQYKKELESYGYILVSKYKGTRSKAKFIHNVCNQEFEQQARNAKYIKCTKCKDGVRKIDLYQKEIDEIYGKGQYILCHFNSTLDLTVKHKCGNIKNTKMSNLRHQYKCPNCEGGHNYHTKESFKEAFKESMGDEYVLLEEFSNSNTPILVKHLECGKEYKAYSRHLLNGHKCRQCTLNRLWGKRDNNFFLERFNKSPDSIEYELVSDYKNMGTPITLLHSICGKEFTALPQNILGSGTRCGYCNISKGEKRIKYFLENLNVNYQEQITFDDCINPETEKKLKFDFGIYIDNDLKLLVEYDGKQHFKAVPHFGGEEKLRLQQYLDQVKNNYCKERNIPLLRIPYTKFNKIEEILSKELPQYISFEKVPLFS